MQSCSADWYLTIREKLGLGPNDSLATSEFSASGNADTYQSCASGKARPVSPSNHEAYRDAILRYQVGDARTAGIEAYFWTWTIPYNENYQNEWSLVNIAR
jgi:hypothetical protein